MLDRAATRREAMGRVIGCRIGRLGSVSETTVRPRAVA
jgi:hypothetical protein